MGLWMQTQKLSYNKLQRYLIFTIICVFLCILYLVIWDTSRLRCILGYDTSGIPNFRREENAFTSEAILFTPVLNAPPAFLKGNLNFTREENAFTSEAILLTSVTNSSPAFLQGNEYLTLHCNGGRLGNQMCTLGSLYGLASLNHRKPASLPCNYYNLNQIFDLEIPAVNLTTFLEHRPWSIGTYLLPEDNRIPKDTNIIKGYYYPCSYTFFNHVRKEIRKLFRFTSNIQTYADQALMNVTNITTNTTFVGIHVRRGDFVPDGPDKKAWLKSFEGREVDLEYFQKAIKYFKDKYENVTFVAVSDDRQWCHDHLTQFGVHVLPDVPSPAHDMAILTTCDHVIMTYGTFGFWSAYLAGGEVVYFDKFLKPNTDFTNREYIREKMYLPEWVGIVTNSSYNYNDTEQHR